MVVAVERALLLSDVVRVILVLRERCARPPLLNSWRHRNITNHLLLLDLWGDSLRDLVVFV
jgi:hypothetical protein